MDKIIIDSLKIFAYHGVNPEETLMGQWFVLDIEAWADLTNACTTDAAMNRKRLRCLSQRYGTIITILIANVRILYRYSFMQMAQQWANRLL